MVMPIIISVGSLSLLIGSIAFFVIRWKKEVARNTKNRIVYD